MTHNMKPNTLFMAILAIFSAILTISCSKGDNDNLDNPDNPTIALVSKVEISDGRVATFEYDSKNRLIKVTVYAPEDTDWDNGETSYLRNGQNVTIVSRDDDRYDCVLNSMGQVVSSTCNYPDGIVTEFYTYSADCLSEIELNIRVIRIGIRAII